MVFSIKPTDSGAGQIQVFNPTPAVGPAWTSITTGNPVARGDAISLYITLELLQVLYILFSNYRYIAIHFIKRPEIRVNK